jgi:hypothetical protein
MKLFNSCLMVLLVLCVSCAGAEQLQKKGVVAEVIPGNGSVEMILSFEPASADATALSFIIDLPVQYTDADTSRCLSEVPNELAGGCRVVGNELRVIVYNIHNEPIQPLVLGSVVLAGAGAERRGLEAPRARGASGERDSLQRGLSPQTRPAPDPRDEGSSRARFSIASVDIGAVKQ